MNLSLSALRAAAQSSLQRALSAWMLAVLTLAAAPAAAQQSVLLAVDTRLNRVMTLSPFDGTVLNANFITDAGPSGLYDFQTPRAAIQVNNEIWVTDQGPNVNAIFRFDHDGGFLGRIGGNTAGGGLSNVRGAIAMARSNDPNSASAQFYVALQALPELDGRYAVFGRVSKGMEVIDRIQQGDKLIRARVIEGGTLVRAKP